MARKLLWILGILILAALIFVAMRQYEILHMHNQAVTQTDGKMQVSVQNIVPQTKTIQKSYVGYVKPIDEVSVISYIPGFIEEIYVQGGQEVLSGAPLFKLRQDQYKADLDLARAKVEQAEASYKNASSFYDRMKEAGQRAISKTDLDNAKTQFLSAKAALSEAKANLELAQVNYNYTLINASIDGIIGNVEPTVGDYVSPESGALISIIGFNPIHVIFSISNKEYLTEIIGSQSKLLDGWAVKLRLADGSVYEKDGQVKFLNNEISPSTSALEVYADFDNENRALVANAYVDVLLEKQVKDGVFIAQNLVNLEPGGAYVYVLDGQNKIEKIPVQVGVSVGNEYWIKDGLKPGQRVITDKVSSAMVGKQVYIKGAGA